MSWGKFRGQSPGTICLNRSLILGWACLKRPRTTNRPPTGSTKARKGTSLAWTTWDHTGTLTSDGMPSMLMLRMDREIREGFYFLRSIVNNNAQAKTRKLETLEPCLGCLTAPSAPLRMSRPDQNGSTSERRLCQSLWPWGSNLRVRVGARLGPENALWFGWGNLTLLRLAASFWEVASDNGIRYTPNTSPIHPATIISHW